MLKAKAAHISSAPDNEVAKSTVLKADIESKASTAASKRADTTQQEGDEGGAVEAKQSEVAKGRKGARKEQVRADVEAKEDEKDEKAENVEVEDDEVVSLTEFMKGQTTRAKPTSDSKHTEQKRTKTQQKEKKQRADAEEEEDEDEEEDDEEGEGEFDASTLEPALNDDGFWEVQAAVDYDEPADDNLPRVYVSREHEPKEYGKAQRAGKETIMAKYYRRAPFRVLEKVNAKWKDGRW